MKKQGAPANPVEEQASPRWAATGAQREVPKTTPPTINIKRRLKNRRSPPQHLKETHAATGDARGAGAGPRRGPAAFLPTASRGHPSVVPSPVSAAGTDAPPFGGDAAGASTARE